MKYLIDTHTHTLACNHAFSTLEENVAAAASKGIEILCFTEHGPKMPYAPPDWFYAELHRIPQIINGVRVLTGLEANITDDCGSTDIDNMPKNAIKFVIASLHKHTYQPSKENNVTQALLNLLDNPFIDMLGHMDTPFFSINYEAVIKKAAQTNTLIEFNNGSLHGVRKGGEANMFQMAKYCKKYDCLAAFGSDAHFSMDVGEFSTVAGILNELNFPEELLINDKPDLFFDILKTNGKHI
ncbi:MAG: phosphatase [Eubacteriaceae bacterium]|nr:phosphatase [Eubacteriaceae bacterium]